jgi:hypothetical protein
MTARIDDDDDFTLVAEPPARTRRKPSANGNRRAQGRRLGRLAFLTRRPARTVMGAIVSALLTGIVVNALVLQKEKHPAPLFVPAEPANAPAHIRSAPAASANAAAGRQQTETKEKDAIGALLRPNAVEKSPAASAPKPRDTIASLLRGNAADDARPDSERVEAKPKDSIAALIKSKAPPEAADPSSGRVAAAQQALVRLGFVLRADGAFGAATKQAIELFERDHRMPVDGDLSPRVLKRLSALSGIAIP